MYPPVPSRHTSYRQRENAGQDLNTAALDGELNDVMACIAQIVTFLRLLAAADGTLISQFNKAFSSFAGQQQFTASSQSIFQTLIPYSASMTNLSVAVFVAGLIVPPSGYTIASYTSGGNQYLQVSLLTPATGAVIIQAYDSNTTQVLNQFTSLAAQVAFTTTIPYSSNYTASSVDVFVNGSRVDPTTATISQTGGMLVVTLGAAPTTGSTVLVVAKGLGATILQRLADVTSYDNGANMVGVQDVNAVYGAATVEGCLYEIRYLFNQLVTQLGPIAHLWTDAGVALGGGAAMADFDMGTHRVKNLADGVANTDAVTVQQVALLTQDLSNLLTLFIRKDGTVVFAADQSMGGHLLTDVGNGTNPNDAVNKSQLDGLNSLIVALQTTVNTLDAENIKRSGLVKLRGHWVAGDPVDVMGLATALGIGVVLAIYKNGSGTALVQNTDWKFDPFDATKIQLLAPQLPMLPTDTFILKTHVPPSMTETTLVLNTDWWYAFRQIKGIMPGTDPNDAATVSQIQALSGEIGIVAASDVGATLPITDWTTPNTPGSITTTLRVGRLAAAIEKVDGLGVFNFHSQGDGVADAVVTLRGIAPVRASVVFTGVNLWLTVENLALGTHSFAAIAGDNSGHGYSTLLGPTFATGGLVALVPADSTWRCVLELTAVSNVSARRNALEARARLVSGDLYLDFTYVAYGNGSDAACQYGGVVPTAIYLSRGG